MRKVLGLVGATLLFAGPALAADLGKPPPAYKAPALMPVSSWAGFYIGIHGGYGWGHESLSFADPIFAELFPTSNSPKGGVFGVQAGYNWQFGTFVTGLEVDFSGADLKDSKSNTFLIEDEVTLTATTSSKVDYFGSFRARAGVLLMPDWLLYGTAGLGWAHDKLTLTLSDNVGDSASASASKDHVGWAAGAGVEYKLTPNLLLRAEYLHYGFGSATYDFGGEPANSKLSIDVVRGGLSYKF
jgi:opacity protein-like surface antigen